MSGRAGLRVRLMTGLAWMWWQGVLVFGRDISEASRLRSCVVVAPHPDDETLGCAATIRAKVLAGTPVTVVVATDGRHSNVSAMVSPSELSVIRFGELVGALAELGLDPSHLRHLNFEDGTLGNNLPALTDRLREIFDELDPDDILVTSPRDGHADHIAISSATIEAAGTHPRAQLSTYPIWWRFAGYDRRTAKTGPKWRRGLQRIGFLFSGAFQVRASLVAIEPHLEAKQRALAAHRSQVENLTGEAEWRSLPPGFLGRFLGEFEVFFPQRRRRR